MTRKIFTQEQIKELSKNKNVRRCSAKSVRYRRNFKLSALRQYNEEGISAVRIFEEAGFDLNLIGIRKPNKLMNQWNRAFKVKKEKEPARPEVTEKRIRNGRELRDLKAKVEYLKTENRFLERLRAGKRQLS